MRTPLSFYFSPLAVSLSHRVGDRDGRPPYCHSIYLLLQCIFHMQLDMGMEGHLIVILSLPLCWCTLPLCKRIGLLTPLSPSQKEVGRRCN